MDFPEWIYDVHRQNGWKLIPGRSGLWVDLHFVAHLLQMNYDRLRKKASSLPRHPMFPGLVRMADFEDLRE